MKRLMYRQGDVLIERVAKRPTTAVKPVARENGKIVLAHGEVTGHAHAIEEKGVALFSGGVNGVTYLEVESAMAALRHEEHATIELPTGTYRVQRQREYAPDEIRNVAD